MACMYHRFASVVHPNGFPGCGLMAGSWLWINWCKGADALPSRDLSSDDSADEGSSFVADSGCLQKDESAGCTGCTATQTEWDVTSKPPLENTSGHFAASDDRKDVPAICQSLPDCITQIQAIVRSLTQALPSDTPSSIIRNMLAYIIYTKLHWWVKFCTQLASGRLPSPILSPWFEDILVVSPSQGIQCIVDLDFRSKFMVQSSQYSEILSSIPSVYVGSLSQLAKDVEKWTAPFTELFARKQLTLPPWRRRGIFMKTYEACVDCDATSSHVCLQNINTQLVQAGEGVGPLEDQHISCLLTLLGGSEMAYNRQPYFAEDDRADSYFEKEQEAGSMLDPVHSGLSELLEGMQDTDGWCLLLQGSSFNLPPAQETDSSWLIKAFSAAPKKLKWYA